MEINGDLVLEVLEQLNASCRRVNPGVTREEPFNKPPELESVDGSSVSRALNTIFKRNEAAFREEGLERVAVITAMLVSFQLGVLCGRMDAADMLYSQE